MVEYRGKNRERVWEREKMVGFSTESVEKLLLYEKGREKVIGESWERVAKFGEERVSKN